MENANNTKTYVISDPHFYHKNVIKYENRPFLSVEEMNEKIVNNWNAVVGKNDTVYVLGDVALGPHSKEELTNLIKSLNGKKILIMGNHDKSKSINYYYDIGFSQVTNKPILYHYNVVLMHEPPEKTQLVDGIFYIHGHTHLKPCYVDRFLNCINVSVEAINYRPVNLEQLCDFVTHNKKHKWIREHGVSINEKMMKFYTDKVFGAFDFSEYDPEDVTKTFSDLEKKGEIKKVENWGIKIDNELLQTFDLYYFPKYIKAIDEWAVANPYEIINAIVRKSGYICVPNRSRALNLLQLSTQVPAIYTYAWDGPECEYVINNCKCKFTHTNRCNLELRSDLSKLVVQVIISENYNQEIMKTLSKKLTKTEKNQILLETKKIDKNIREKIENICK